MSRPMCWSVVSMVTANPRNDRPNGTMIAAAVSVAFVPRNAPVSLPRQIDPAGSVTNNP